MSVHDNDSESESEFLSSVESDNDDKNTYLLRDDSDEESFIQKSHKLKNTKYLNTLNNKELRDIMKFNNLKVTNKGGYLNKTQMVKNIKKNI